MSSKYLVSHFNLNFKADFFSKDFSMYCFDFNSWKRLSGIYLSLPLIHFSVKSYHLKIFVSMTTHTEQSLAQPSDSRQILFWFDLHKKSSISKPTVSIWRSIENTELVEHFSSEFFWSLPFLKHFIF